MIRNVHKPHPCRATAGRAAGALLLGSLASGCAAPPPATAPPEPAAWLEIVEPLEIPAGSAHVDLQDGGPVAGVDRTRLYCALEVDRVAERPQTVPPQRLAVVEVERRILADEQANIPAFRAWTFSCSEDRYYRVRIDLRGGSPSGVRDLTCTEWFTSCDLGAFATLDEIERTVGPKIRWRTPQPGRWDEQSGGYQ